jgi:hypothetical protein
MVGSGHRQVAEPTALSASWRRWPNGEQKQWHSALHGLMLIAEYAAFPGKIARSGDAVSDPLGRWRCAQIRANQSPRSNSREQGNFQGISHLWRIQLAAKTAGELAGTPFWRQRDAKLASSKQGT